MSIINSHEIEKELAAQINVDDKKIDDILSKAKELKGLSYNDVLTLLSIKSQDHLSLTKLFDTAAYVKDEIYGKRLVIFAPLYISNRCQNECLYCAFRNNNSGMLRKTLTQDELKEETQILLSQGHKRLLLVAGEDSRSDSIDYVLQSIQTVYGVKNSQGQSINRINVNVAPLSVEDFARLHQMNVGTYQIFQETYHQETYEKLHLKGPKKDYNYRLETIDRAFKAGFEDVGIGALFGLYNWRFEVLALLSHIKHLEKNFGVGPHTISLPRIEPAHNSSLSLAPEYGVGDDDFLKIIAVLRLAVPYTGLILSTRESAAVRRQAFNLGISQISAGSKTNPGGYKKHLEESLNDPSNKQQFSLGDTRTLSEVIDDIVDHGYVPSFCTGCYRKGRVGNDFMDLAKPGLIKSYCLPNAFFSFAEYLHDFATPELKVKGMNLIHQMIDANSSSTPSPESLKVKLQEITEGKRDIYL